MHWLKRAWAGFRETYFDCPPMVVAVVFFAGACWAVAWLVGSWPLAAVGFVLAVILAVVGYTHPEASDEYGADGP